MANVPKLTQPAGPNAPKCSHQNLMGEEVALSITAKQRLTAELAQLNTELDESRTHQGKSGDSADLAETSAGVERRRHIERRIRKIDQLLSAQDTDDTIAPNGTVHFGCAVSLRYPGESEAEDFWVGDIDTSDAEVAVITPESPLGQALLGARPGAHVEYQAPAGVMSVEVVSVR